MKKEIITHMSSEWIYEHCGSVSDIELVTNYLRDNNLTIQVNECHDSQAGWTGANIILEGIDLSGNGYCFRKYRLIDHINNYRKYIKVSESKEYQDYLILVDKFKEVDSYLNQ